MNIKSRKIALLILEGSSTSHKHIADYSSAYLNKNNVELSDRKFINKLVMGTTRLKGRYDSIISDLYRGDFSTLKPKLRKILRIGLYQIENMDSVPDHAAISTTVDLTKVFLLGYDKLVNAILRNFLLKKEKYLPIVGEKKTYELLSHPEWLINKWINSFGDDTAISICSYNNIDPVIWFRINDISSYKLIYTKLRKITGDIEEHETSGYYFKSLKETYKILESKLFSNGSISVQNPINGFIVNILNPKNNEVIVDGCSSPGGKGSLISILAPQSKIYSIEVNKKRIEKIKSTINRTNIKNIEILNLDMTRDSFPLSDRILLDVPCSGTAVINRRADLRWKRKQKDILELSKLQYRILENSSRFLKKNGVIVYSTCSIEEEENFLVIDKFLKQNKGYVLENCSNYINEKLVKEKCLNLLPGKFNLDGGFAARLRKV